MEKMIDIPMPFFQITESVSGESYGTLSSIKPLLHHLLNDALNPASDDPSVIKQLKEAVKKNLEQCYQSPEVSKLLDVARFIDSRFKELPFHSVTECSRLYTVVRDGAAALYTELSSQSTDDVVVSVTSTSEDSGSPRKKTKSSAEAVQTRHLSTV